MYCVGVRNVLRTPKCLKPAWIKALRRFCPDKLYMFYIGMFFRSGMMGAAPRPHRLKGVDKGAFGLAHRPLARGQGNPLTHTTPPPTLINKLPLNTNSGPYARLSPVGA